ncbi:MAG: PDZ domain-containing protein [Atopostipes suicloacalis]|nr:PDZ domain-containing protein [Atopostipes suicloacalis]
MKKIPKWFRKLLFFIILLFMFFFPLPFYLEVPGSIFPLSDMVEVDHQYEELSGEYYITTVGVKQATPVTIFQTFLPYHDLVSESKLLGNLDNFENYNRIQKYNMNHSINSAIKVAFDAAGKSYDLDYKGVYVLQVIEASDFFAKLEVGDIVESVDGQKFQSSAKFMDYIGNKNVGEKIRLEVKRAGEEIDISGNLIELENGASGIGIALTDNSEIVTEPSVQIHSADIGGPSAGLMFAIDIYTQLIDKSLSKGYRIAGTGTIESDGQIGRIGGVEKKIVAAARENVDYFFVPDDEPQSGEKKLNSTYQSNYDLAQETADKINTGLMIIPVKKFQDALDFLNALKRNKNVDDEKENINLATIRTTN